MTTTEKIIAVADQIAAAGQRPTLAAVRAALGGGSYTTISEALRAWRARQATAPSQEPAPQAVADRLAAVGAEIWAHALELAQARLAAEREALEQARAELEAGRAEALALADTLTTQLEEQKGRLESVEAAEQAARAEASAALSELAAARERAVVAEARADELRRELDRAHADVLRMQDALVAAREEVAALRARGGGLRDS